MATVLTILGAWLAASVVTAAAWSVVLCWDRRRALASGWRV